MAKIERVAKQRNESKYGNRFYTSVDMAIIKKDAADANGRKKRGEQSNHPNQYISRCGCGREGCFIHGSNESYPTQEQKNEVYNRYPHNHHPKN